MNTSKVSIVTGGYKRNWSPLYYNFQNNRFKWKKFSFRVVRVLWPSWHNYHLHPRLWPISLRPLLVNGMVGLIFIPLKYAWRLHY